ncbi:MAG: hypothetical protein HWN67_07610 [Candidatus Helarchaeota archaeon]|nr:hypothetical protein [Candidatus Helarchaeota archaeon]
MIRNFKLGKFENKSTYSSEGWSGRFLEEIEKLDKLRSFNWENKFNLTLIKAQFDIVNQRQMYCTIRLKSTISDRHKFVSFIIRLPLRYPEVPPKATDFSVFDFIKDHHDYRRWDDEDSDFKNFRHACLGELEKRWEKDGSMGIAHYIQMLFYYAAFDHFAIKL